jgi:hypothetical protein
VWALRKGCGKSSVLPRQHRPKNRAKKPPKNIGKNNPQPMPRTLHYILICFREMEISDNVRVLLKKHRAVEVGPTTWIAMHDGLIFDFYRAVTDTAGRHCGIVLIPLLPHQGSVHIQHWPEMEEDLKSVGIRPPS